ncbi:ribosome maturation factor RimM [Pedobacter faecalis]|uniref:ribosome maturation factor RimM n=1 Tax=Pedobacter faecalis TaxID=3041495 RepID=UPI00254B14E4|nr:ribosome maturation factor RimM [Pedobacter sp. ELA7]
MTQEEAFYIGYITKTRGLKGEVQIFFEYDSPSELDLSVLFADIQGKMVPFFTASYKLHTNNTGYFTFDDLDHIDKAQILLKKRIYLPFSKKPERTPDEFYYEDLVGFFVTDEKLGALGKVIQVHEYPQQFVATVKYQEKEIMFPLTDEFIQEVDDEEKRLLVQLPEGLLDVYL